jgi:uncharacterized protein YukE
VSVKAQDIDYVYISDDQYVETIGDNHTLYGKDPSGADVPIKFWAGDDESQASWYGPGDLPGQYTVTNPDKAVTLYGSDQMPIKTWVNDGSGKIIDWKVDLEVLRNAISSVGDVRDAIHAALWKLGAILDLASEHWQTPAASSYNRLADDFNSGSQRLRDTVDDALERMKIALRNYTNTETTHADGMRQLRQLLK